MPESYQLSFDDLDQQLVLTSTPGKTAYIDECGSFGFDFTAEGNSRYYLLCAVVVENDRISDLHTAMNEIKHNNGFKDTELKSSRIGSDHKRRVRIISQLLPVEFRVVLLIADKQRFVEGSPLVEYKKTFIKYLHQRLYNTLYHAYPKLSIIEDETGSSEFQTSFKKYVESQRPEFNLFNEYDFSYTDSRDEILVQLADLVGGSINKYLTGSDSPNYLEMLRAKVLTIDEFPNRKEPYWGTATAEDFKFDRDIYELSMKCAKDYIEKHRADDSEEKRSQIAFLQHLIFQVNNNPSQYISSYQLVSLLRTYLGRKISRDFLYRRVVAKLRDEGVLIASCPQGYKLPISVDDIVAYLNQTHMIVSPMLNRMGKCRNLIIQRTSGRLDILDNPAFLKYKKYFE